VTIVYVERRDPQTNRRQQGTRAVQRGVTTLPAATIPPNF
jgi:hypothetical protein